MEYQCSHPSSALYADKEQGVTICTLCLDVVTHQVYELDPQFPRGGASSSRLTAGNYRPTRGQVSLPSTHPRPSMEAARRGMQSIARQLEINEDHVEMALGIYKLAVALNVISGTRDVVLCACLYAVCRRERTPHVIFDFCFACNVSASAVLSQMAIICQATHTEVPVVDPSCMVQRFAEYLNLGDATESVLVCALKLLRAMRDDWIACGRRPMGVCAAALIAACYMLGVPRTPEQICSVIRMSGVTIAKRLSELSNTPTALLTSIDAYEPSSSTLPPAFTDSSLLAIEEDLHAEQRQLAALYFELVGEAKVSAPATPERCKKWRHFISTHSRISGATPTEQELDLECLTPHQQLIILGLPNTTPIDPDRVKESMTKEKERLLKMEEEATGSGRCKYKNEWGAGMCEVSGSLEQLDGATEMERLLAEYETAKRLPEIASLTNDFGLDDPLSARDNGEDGVTRLSDEADLLPRREGEEEVLQGTAPPSTGLTQKERLAEMMFDKERRHALPWEILVLQDVEAEDPSDIIPYIILDNEERLRRDALGREMYKQLWERGRPKSDDIVRTLGSARQPKRRRRIERAVGIPNALQRELRAAGARTVCVSNISQLVPELELGDDLGISDGGDDDEWVD